MPSRYSFTSAVIAAAVVSLCSCTFVSIEGDNNSVSDTGGHGGGFITSPDSGQGNVAERLRTLRGE